MMTFFDVEFYGQDIIKKDKEFKLRYTATIEVDDKIMGSELSLSDTIDFFDSKAIKLLNDGYKEELRGYKIQWVHFDWLTDEGCYSQGTFVVWNAAKQKYEI